MEPILLIALIVVVALTTAIRARPSVPRPRSAQYRASVPRWHREEVELTPAHAWYCPARHWLADNDRE